jgi:hypothetical protein
VHALRHGIDADEQDNVCLVQDSGFDHVGIEQSEKHSRPPRMGLREHSSCIHGDQGGRSNRFDQSPQFLDCSSSRHVGPDHDHGPALGPQEFFQPGQCCWVWQCHRPE